MDGASRNTSGYGSCSQMILSHLQLPTLILISPLMGWGMWLISESMYDSWGNWHHSITQHLKPDTSTEARSIRRRSIFFNFAVGLSICVLIYFLIFISPNSTVLVISAIFIASVVLAYWNGESQRIAKRESLAFEGELPTYMQLMTVLISSGVSPARSMDLLSRRSTSVSGERLQEVVSQIREGIAVVEALDGLARMYDILVLRRFVNVLILGIERGSSLTPMLISQVKDARIARKNQILQRAGKAEIALMIPVVFLILPISILFALWPSYQQLGSFI